MFAILSLLDDGVVCARNALHWRCILPNERQACVSVLILVKIQSGEIRKSTLEFSMFPPLVKCLRAFKVFLWLFLAYRFVSFLFLAKWSTFFHFDIESLGQMSLLYKLQLAVVVVAAKIATVQRQTL